jgi:hypothetical protein
MSPPVIKKESGGDDVEADEAKTCLFLVTMMPVRRQNISAASALFWPVLKRFFMNLDIDFHHPRLQTFLHISDGFVIHQRADFFEKKLSKPSASRPLTGSGKFSRQ